MDKLFAFILSGFFIFCAAVITWGVYGEKRNRSCMPMANVYTALLWISVIALAAITIIHKGI